jgi:hypothetical protein
MVQNTPVLLRCNRTGKYSQFPFALWGKRKILSKEEFQTY